MKLMMTPKQAEMLSHRLKKGKSFKLKHARLAHEGDFDFIEDLEIEIRDRRKKTKEKEIEWRN